jgi:hypothetical protein
MSNKNNNIIKKLVTEFNTLHSEYQTKLSLYVSTKESYLQELQKVNKIDKCKSDFMKGAGNGNNINISQECYNQIWKEEMCTTPTPKVDPKKSLKELAEYVFSISTSNTAADKKLCYGNVQSPNINTATKYYINRNEKNFSIQNNSTWVPASVSDNSKVYTHQVNDANRCLQMCAIGAPGQQCTGATYDTSNATKTCSLVIAPGKLVATRDTNKTAIYSKLFFDYSIQLQSLNDELLAIMTSLESKREEIQSNLDLVNIDLLNIEGPLRSDYATLIDEKQKLSDMINKYNDIEASYKEEKQSANDEIKHLRLWSIVAIILILFIIKHFFGFDSPSINVVFWITIFIVLGLSLNTPSGFAAMGILFLVFLILTINRINS